MDRFWLIDIVIATKEFCNSKDIFSDRSAFLFFAHALIFLKPKFGTGFFLWWGLTGNMCNIGSTAIMMSAEGTRRRN